MSADQPRSSVLASVLICTRNRAAYLGSTIREAAAQALSSGDFEIIVVDNGSTDHTPDVVRECQVTVTKVPLRYVVEPEVGLSAARNRAMREAGGLILCFLDDDAVPEPGWLEWLVRGYDGNPRVMCVGGAVLPVYEAVRPAWLPDELELTFRPATADSGLHPVTYPDYPYGANLSVRAEAARLVGGFNTSLGYKGRKVIPCEETEFLLRLELAGYEIRMETRAVVRHLIPASRLTRSSLRRRRYASGRGFALLENCHRTQTVGRQPWLPEVWRLVAHSVHNLRLRGRYWRHRTRHQHHAEPEVFLRECQLAERLGRSDQEWTILWHRLWGRCSLSSLPNTREA